MKNRTNIDKGGDVTFEVLPFPKQDGVYEVIGVTNLITPILLLRSYLYKTYLINYPIILCNFTIVYDSS